MTTRQRKIYRAVQNKNLRVEFVKNDPLSNIPVDRILFRADDGNDRIVPRVSEVHDIISLFYKRMKGEGAKKLQARISQHFIGISGECIQKWINNNKDHCKVKPVFSNRPPLRPKSLKV